MGRAGSAWRCSGEKRAWPATRPSSSTRRSRLLVPGSVPATRRIGGSESLGQGVDFPGVEYLIVAFKEPGDGRLVDLHLGAAHAHRPIANHAVAVDTLVDNFEALDPK